MFSAAQTALLADGHVELGARPSAGTMITKFGSIVYAGLTLNSLRPRQNGRYNADGILKCIFLNKNVWFPTKISLKFVPTGPINNIPALVQIMAWPRPGDKELSEPMLVRIPTHICVTRPQWVKGSVNSLWPCDTMWHQRSWSIWWGNSLLPDGPKPLPHPMLTCHELDHQDHISINFSINVHSRKCIWKYPLQNVAHIVQASLC